MESRYIRNIGTIAHIDAGKTTFSERILFYSDVTYRMGEVHEGAAAMDFLPEEQERGITIAAACSSCKWGDYLINLLDTPGHVDFTIEVERSLRVLDGAIGIFCAVAGVEPQSETVWRQADNFFLPRFAVINKMDRAGASFSGALEAIRQRLHVRPVPLVIPVGEGETFSAVIDIVRRERLIFDQESKGRVVMHSPLEPDDEVLCAPWREILLDVLTEHDDELLALWLGGEPISAERLDCAIRQSVMKRTFVPVFAAAALRNIGIQPVLDAICRYMPSPVEIPTIQAHTWYPASQKDTTKALQLTQSSDASLEVMPDKDAPFCGLVFKVLIEAKRRVVFVRVYAGTLRANDAVFNSSQSAAERAQRLFRLYADRKEEVTDAGPGEIVLVYGLRYAKTGDTLTAPGHPLLLEPVRTLSPVIALAFEPKNTEEGDRLDEALSMILAEDPTLQLVIDEATGQRVVSGMGELHLEVVSNRLHRDFNVEPRVGNPQVVCRQTVRSEVAAEQEIDRELGGQPQYGFVALTLSPAERGSGICLRGLDGLEGWHETFLAAVKDSLHGVCSRGIEDIPLDDITITVTELRRKENKVTVAGLHLAAQHALERACRAAGLVTLEPLMELTVTVPNAHLGSIMTLLGTRGAKVEQVNDLGTADSQMSVKAIAPMRNLFGFSTALRSASQGRAGVFMQFIRYDAVS